MEELVKFNIDEIMFETPIEYAGHLLDEYISIRLWDFQRGLRKYTINALFDMENADGFLVIADYETSVIVTKFYGE